MKFKFLFFALVVTFFCACHTIDEPGVFELNTEEEFVLNESYFSPRSNLKFSLIKINDSRCPTGVYCVWQGEVRVTLAIDKPVIDTLELSSYDNKMDSTGGYSFELLTVSPYPDVDSVIQMEDYTVVLKIKREN